MQIQLKVWFSSAFQAVMLRVSVLDYSLTPETVEILTKGNTITLPQRSGDVFCLKYLRSYAGHPHGKT